MNEWKLIKQFRKYFNASKIDLRHRHKDESLMGPFAPLIIHINGKPIGCVDLRKLPGTIDGYVELAYIYMYNEKKGHGSIVLNKICELADLHGLEVELDAVPIKKLRAPIPKSKLHNFYIKFGFKKSDVQGSNMMTRYPHA